MTRADGATAPAYPCRMCGRPVVWARTDHGRSMPIDRDPAAPDLGAYWVLWFYEEEEPHPTQRVSYVPPRDPRYVGPRWVSHMVTCPNRDARAHLRERDQREPEKRQLSLFTGGRR